jgi:hypothetical protein
MAHQQQRALVRRFSTALIVAASIHAPCSAMLALAENRFPIAVDRAYYGLLAASVMVGFTIVVRRSRDRATLALGVLYLSVVIPALVWLSFVISAIVNGDGI